MEISSSELKQKIDNGEKLIVDFHASWCGPCKILKPIYEKVANEMKTQNSEVQLYTMDVDKNRDLVVSLGVRSVPTIKSFNNGEVVTTKVGVIPETQLSEMAKNLING
jgi:thioredoxin 1